MLFDKSFILYHRETPVMKISYNSETDKQTGEKTYFVTNAKKLSDKNLPVFLNYMQEINSPENIDKLSFWIFKVRCIPEYRDGLKSKLKDLKIKSNTDLVKFSMGLSLNDCYWYGKNENSGMVWKTLNCFENKFSEDIGELLMTGYMCDLKNFKGVDPAVTINGRMKKMWHNSDNKALLFKGAENFDLGGYTYQCANEVLASKVAEILNLNHVDYFISTHKVNARSSATKVDMPVSICENFVDINTEYIPLSLFESIKSPKINSLHAFEELANKLNIDKQQFDDYVSKYIALSLIMFNTDFNKGNIGFCRNINTNTFSMAPSFDVESSLGLHAYSSNRSRNNKYKKTTKEVFEFENIKNDFNNFLKNGNKVFGNSYEDMLSNIRNFDFFDIEKIKTIPYIAKEIFSSAGVDNNITVGVETLLVASTNKLIKYIEQTRKGDAILNSINETEELGKDVIYHEER